MGLQASLERFAGPSEDAATPRLAALPEQESAGRKPGLDRPVAAAILGGVAATYVVLAVLIYVAVTALA